MRFALRIIALAAMSTFTMLTSLYMIELHQPYVEWNALVAGLVIVALLFDVIGTLTGLAVIIATIMTMVRRCTRVVAFLVYVIKRFFQHKFLVYFPRRYTTDQQHNPVNFTDNFSSSPYPKFAITKILLI